MNKAVRLLGIGGGLFLSDLIISASEPGFLLPLMTQGLIGLAGWFGFRAARLR
jgi:hypothetical protein